MTQNIREKNKDYPHSLAGKVLLAMPGMGDTRFDRAVIYICAHDAQGAMGLAVNQTLPDMELQNLLNQIGLESNIRFDLEKISMPVMSGGPVDGSRGFLLHTNNFERAETVKVDEQFSVSGTVDALKDFAKGEGEGEFLFMLGYAGWSAGQLDEEVQQNAWLVCDADPSIVFSDKADEKWVMALNKIGVNPAMLSTQGGRA